MPDIEESHMLEVAKEIGLYKVGFNGLTPIDWVDIQAYMNVTGMRLTVEEVRLVKSLSEQFCGQFNASKNPREPSPHMPKQSFAQRNVLFSGHPAYS